MKKYKGNWRVRYRCEQLHDFKYQKVSTIGCCCIYCGKPAKTLDHIPPISAAHLYTGTFVKVPACSRCNTFLHNRLFVTLEERKQYLIERYCERYKKDLKIPSWRLRELEKLQGFLNGYIDRGLKLKKDVMSRLSYLAFQESLADYVEDFSPIKQRG
jgi:hypothetical protein